MNLFLVTFQAVAALLGIGVVGFWIIGRRRMPADALGLLTSIAIDIALPCLVLGNIITQFSVREFPDWWQMPLWWAGFTAVAFVLSMAASLLARKDIRGEFAMSLFFQNGIFFPVIIINGLFPGQAPAYNAQLFLFIFMQASLIFSVYALFFRGKSPTATLNWKRIVNPVLVATIIGIIIGVTRVNTEVPKFLVTGLNLIGAMAIPLFMLILGGNIYNDFMGRGKQGIYAAEVIKFTLFKNIVFPLVFLGLLILVRPSFIVAFIIILQAAIPPITATPILAEREKGNRAITSQFIVATFTFSIISIPAVIYLFSLFFPFPG